MFSLINQKKKMNLRNLVHIILEKNWTLLIFESMHMKIDEKIVIIQISSYTFLVQIQNFIHLQDQ
ncbi:MAG: hypothetical protein A2015_01205 [Spirochaetes bacterium GWF1_31_7]|nr:MAG: hypothetical protein A2Y30_01105 [Spirochaetes bacterium GWE1_32_154]OHD47915.1 MAG: hypothetical protein A2015_01205 [Spirochaetes bacterium GWF1_31_7]OHD48907.1 MAG: hypothetical protein A2Y29_16920 [Spirochaetes bacterium GWE2_31_10]